MTPIIITAIVCSTCLAGTWMLYRTDSGLDRYLEMQRVLSTIETRCKVLEGTQRAHVDAVSEFYGRFDTLKGQRFAPLVALDDIREDISAFKHATKNDVSALADDVRVASLKADTIERRLVDVSAAFEEKASRLSMMLAQAKPGHMRT
jgi:hypothetical protein